MKIIPSPDFSHLIPFCKEYVKTNPCCNNVGNCKHAQLQSDDGLFYQKEMKAMKDSFQSILSFLKNRKFTRQKAWVYWVPKGETIKEENWHDHKGRGNEKGVSCLLYLTDTEYGTEYNYDFFELKTKPRKNYWYIFDNHVMHRPMSGIVKEDRIVIAASIYYVD